jgi:hypothetical protein
MLPHIATIANTDSTFFIKFSSALTHNFFKHSFRSAAGSACRAAAAATGKDS